MDHLCGENGDDHLTPGAGLDRLWGGSGADTFVFEEGSGLNIIYDFETGVDRIHHADALLQVLVEHLDMPGLVEGLRRGLKLGVEGRRTGTRLRGHQQGTLFPVQELRQAPGIHVQPEFALGGVIHVQAKKAI